MDEIIGVGVLFVNAEEERSLIIEKTGLFSINLD
jgi:hypothetical protein